MNSFFDKKSVLFVLIAFCSLSWGASFVATNALLQKLDVFQILAARWSLAVLLFVVLAATKVINLSFKGKPLMPLIITGMIQPVCYAVFEIYGLKYSSSSEAAIIIAVIPLMVLILGMLFFNSKVSAKAIISIVIAFAGILISILFSPGFTIGGSRALGYIFLAGAVICGGLYNHASNKASADYSPLEITFGMAVLGAIAFNIVNFAKGDGLQTYIMCFGDAKLTAGILFLGVMCSSFCYIVFNLSIKKVKPIIASNLVANSTTVIGVILGCAIDGNPFGWYTVVGVLMTMFGIIMASTLDS